jgi:hypothetical protein
MVGRLTGRSSSSLDFGQMAAAYAGVSSARLADGEDFWEKIRAAYVPPSSGTEASNAEV